MTQDPTVDIVIKKFIDRSNTGMVKYGVSMADNPADLLAWLNHLQEELMDATLYLERVKQEIVTEMDKTV